MDMSNFERQPVDVRGPLAGHDVRVRQRVSTFARTFVRDGQLYIAESQDYGRTVREVTAYPVPDEEPIIRGNTIKWGPWVFSGCSSCRAGRSKWKTHTTDSLIALAQQ